MNLKELKKEVNSLPPLAQTISQFESTFLKEINKNTNKNFPFLQNLSPSNKKLLNQQLLQLKKILTPLKQSPLNEKLNSLAHYLLEIKISLLTKDSKKTKRLLKKFLNDPYLNLKTLISETLYLENQLSLLKNSHYHLLQNLTPHLSLKQNLLLSTGKHQTHLNFLFVINKKQKFYLKQITLSFLQLAYQLKNNLYEKP